MRAGPAGRRCMRRATPGMPSSPAATSASCAASVLQYAVAPVSMLNQTGTPRLRMVANMAVGFNNIDVEAATRLRIAVSNTPGVLSDTTADLAFALLMIFGYDLFFSPARGDRQVAIDPTPLIAVHFDDGILHLDFRHWGPFLECADGWIAEVIRPACVPRRLQIRSRSAPTARY